MNEGNAAPSTRYIDVHQHVLPPAYRDALQRFGVKRGGGAQFDFPEWSVESALGMMDRRGIEVGILSLVEPGVHFAGPAVARELARSVNEFLADLIRDRGDRFGGFATLPLPDIDAAVDELTYALDILELDGVCLLTNYDSLYVGDEVMAPLLVELDRRKVVVFVHPSKPPDNRQPRFGLPIPLYEFTFNTTRVVANLVYGGSLERYPDLCLLLSHAGGTVPFLAQRLTYGPVLSPALADAPTRDVIALLRRLYYDTALSASPYALPSLKALAGVDHILLGCDFPFMPEEIGAETVAGVEQFDGFDSADVAAVTRDNALRLFPRLRDTGPAERS